MERTSQTFLSFPDTHAQRLVSSEQIAIKHCETYRSLLRGFGHQGWAHQVFTWLYTPVFR